MNNRFESIKKLYENGYRCIYYHSNNNNFFTLYLKNFENEKSQIIELSDENEFKKFQSYINELTIY